MGKWAFMRDGAHTVGFGLEDAFDKVGVPMKPSVKGGGWVPDADVLPPAAMPALPKMPPVVQDAFGAFNNALSDPIKAAKSFFFDPTLAEDVVKEAGPAAKAAIKAGVPLMETAVAAAKPVVQPMLDEAASKAVKQQTSPAAVWEQIPLTAKLAGAAAAGIVLVRTFVKFKR